MPPQLACIIGNRPQRKPPPEMPVAHGIPPPTYSLSNSPSGAAGYQPIVRSKAFCDSTASL